VDEKIVVTNNGSLSPLTDSSGEEMTRVIFYAGGVKDNKFQGDGLVVFEDEDHTRGILYKGMFERGLIDGAGTMFWAGGTGKFNSHWKYDQQGNVDVEANGAARVLSFDILLDGTTCPSMENLKLSFQLFFSQFEERSRLRLADAQALYKDKVKGILSSADSTTIVGAEKGTCCDKKLIVLVVLICFVVGAVAVALFYYHRDRTSALKSSATASSSSSASTSSDSESSNSSDDEEQKTGVVAKR